MRKIVSLAAGVAAFTGLILSVTAAPASAAVSCTYNPNPVCVTVPTVSHSYFATTTTLDVTPEPAMYSGTVVTHNLVAPTVTVTGRVRSVSPTGNTASKAGTVKLYFTRALGGGAGYVKSVAVSTSGLFSTTTKAYYTGTWRAVYQGNTFKVSSVKYTHMAASTSAGDAVIVKRVYRAAHVIPAGTLRTNSVTLNDENATTEFINTTPGRPVTVTAVISACTAPMGDFWLGYVRGEGGNGAVLKGGDLTSGTFTQTFSGAAGFTTAGTVADLDAPCNITLTLTQQRPAYTVPAVIQTVN